MAFEAQSSLKEELEILRLVIYKSKNGHRGSKLFRKLVHLKRLSQSFLLNRVKSKREEIRRVSEELYVLATSNIPEGHLISYTLIVLGLCSRIHYLVGGIECIEDTDDIDEMFAEIE
ncbi:hypothetical protein EHEL_060750 [Encephalitozoon hellem ATCC 50504]|uniref:Uncharacterized protein n=1 Tax=Encephalitozoon hellem TaxID=27973 RepID=A0A9Q9F9P9_ENCHE|nr:uncharacterized protein EHEL_060750 [Encephalitozoon hellem ATCC 50504]AFM98447.1 hypothetical protein EHEL_060750 [Encephalitozoon hellem ATCC 50504]UTX43372.1 hypothetical protein GPU96_06g11200 [Encephalitozoon hellem]WEL38836.1 hypothetical protein PFJ87_06g01030 [Encephalitozoon hellem]|eukprot:XP_003887428.1 hypothetical protein EHEL_060750 [Encephalitozoon hellem ATCC 50504]